MEFLATSHGKNACNGVGGSIKRLAAHANLQRLFSNQIFTPKKLFVFAEANVDSVTLIWRYEDMKPGKFYMCQYDNNWYFCVTNYLSSEHGDINMKFLHPKGLSEKFF